MISIVLAQANDSGVDFVDYLLNFGVLGLVFALLLSGVLVPGYLYKKERERADKLEATLWNETMPLTRDLLKTSDRMLDRLDRL